MREARCAAGRREIGSIEIEQRRDGRPRNPVAVQGAWDCGPGTIAATPSRSNASAVTLRRGAAVSRLRGEPRRRR